MAYSAEHRAFAVARVLAGESRRRVAADMGVAHATVRAWLQAAESSETAGGQALALRAHAIAADIEHHETLARNALIKRITALAADSSDLGAVANAYAKLADRALLREGKPTAITKSVDQMDLEIEAMLAKLAKREAERDRAEA